MGGVFHVIGRWRDEPADRRPTQHVPMLYARHTREFSSTHFALEVDKFCDFAGVPTRPPSLSGGAAACCAVA
jgi:hypothetical protein